MPTIRIPTYIEPTIGVWFSPEVEVEAVTAERSRRLFPRRPKRAKIFQVLSPVRYHHPLIGTTTVPVGRLSDGITGKIALKLAGAWRPWYDLAGFVHDETSADIPTAALLIRDSLVDLGMPSRDADRIRHALRNYQYIYRYWYSSEWKLVSAK